MQITRARATRECVLMRIMARGYWMNGNGC